MLDNFDASNVGNDLTFFGNIKALTKNCFTKWKAKPLLKAFIAEKLARGEKKKRYIRLLTGMTGRHYNLFLFLDT